jgi:hypothetical protein
MADLTIKWQDVAGMLRVENAMKRLDGPEKMLVLQRAVNHTGDKARTQVARVLSKQTGLPYGVIRKALKTDRAYGSRQEFVGGPVSVSTDASLSYTIRASGGDISLKYFKARETRAGVTASPFGVRRLYNQAFMKGGRFPNRVTAKGLNGHVYRRTGGGRGPLELLNSGVVIPSEMISGASAKAFTETVSTELPKRTIHEIGALVPGFFD